LIEFGLGREGIKLILGKGDVLEVEKRKILFGFYFRFPFFPSFSKSNGHIYLSSLYFLFLHSLVKCMVTLSLMDKFSLLQNKPVESFLVLLIVQGTPKKIISEN
jgi:hypothetical protein